MKPKVMLISAVLAAFLGGTLFAGYLRSRATSPTPATRTETVAPPRAYYRPVVYREAPAEPVRHHRSWERQVLVVAGGAGAGAAFGAAANGGRGAAVGAIAGGVAGLVYDLASNH